MANEGGEYRAVPRSVALSFLTPGDIERFLSQAAQTDELTLMRSFRDWLATV